MCNEPDSSVRSPGRIGGLVLMGMLACPVCKGVKTSLYGSYPRPPCLCCDGKGEITGKKFLTLQRIRADLRERLLQ